MTKAEKMEAYEMRLSGCTYDEIGKRFFVSRQYIHQLFPETFEGHFKKSVFPNLDKWLLDNGISFAVMLRNCINIYDARCKKIREGRTQLKMNQIKAILEYTWLTFEDAFGVVEGVINNDID